MRRLLRTACLAFVACSIFAQQPKLNAQQAKPNILVIWGDDIGQSNVSAYTMGLMGYRTPNIDRIANEGAMFTDYYGEQSCTAGRSTFILGQSVFRTGLSKVGMPGAELGLQDRDITIAEVLKDAGYQTGMVGKWHLGMDPKKDGPIQRGFDDFYGTMTGAGSFYDPYTLARNTELIEAEGEDYYYTDVIGQEAVRQIEAFAESDQPFFQYVAFTAAHWPIHAPEE